MARKNLSYMVATCVAFLLSSYSSAQTMGARTTTTASPTVSTTVAPSGDGCTTDFNGAYAGIISLDTHDLDQLVNQNATGVYYIASIDTLSTSLNMHLAVVNCSSVVDRHGRSSIDCCGAAQDYKASHYSYFLPSMIANSTNGELGVAEFHMDSAAPVVSDPRCPHMATGVYANGFNVSFHSDVNEMNTKRNGEGNYAPIHPSSMVGIGSFEQRATRMTANATHDFEPACALVPTTTTTTVAPTTTTTVAPTTTTTIAAIAPTTTTTTVTAPTVAAQQGMRVSHNVMSASSKLQGATFGCIVVEVLATLVLLRGIMS